MKTQDSNDQLWFYGPATDLIFGCGLIYIVAFPLLLSLPGRTTLIPFTIVIMLIAGPHYGATYLRIFESDESRRRYGRVFALTTLVVGGMFVVGLSKVTVGAALVMLYMTWSPWHVSGQNYGLSLMFLRKRGVTITPFAKRLLYSAFWLSFAPALLVLHSGADVDYVPIQKSAFDLYPRITLGIPRNLVMTLVPVLVSAYVACLGWLAVLLLRTSTVAAIAPTMLIVMLQSMWFVVPGFLLASGYDLYSSMAYVPIVQSAVHSVQYLWVSSFYKKREDPSARMLPYLASATLAGAAALGVMLLFFSPGLLGSVPYDSGLALLAASALNVHHFAIDGVIWKLRDGPVARALLGTGQEPLASKPIPARIGWMRPVVFAVGMASLVTSAVFVWEWKTLENAEVERYEVGLNRLRLIGRDSALGHARLASMFAQAGNHKRALEEIDRSLELLPNTEAWLIKGQIHEKDHYWSAALEAYEAVLRMDPANDQARGYRRTILRRMQGRG
jgi:hypothetical protein